MSAAQTKVISLVEALTPRASRVAELVASRIPDPGLWGGYRASQGLIGELRFSTLLTFHRPGQPHAVLVFRNPRMAGIRQIDWGEAVVLEENISQRFSSSILLNEPVGYRKQLSHTFSKTVSLLEQVKAGLEATLKVGGEVGTQGGIHGVTAKVYAELTAKIYAEYQRQWGSSATESDTVTDEITRTVTPEELVDGPVSIDYEAARSLNREQRTIRATCDYEHTVELIDERQGLRPEGRPFLQEICDTWAEFREVVQGFAPRNRERELEDGRKVPVPVGFYNEFIRNPVRGEALERLAKPADGAIEVVAEYDNVLKQSIRVA